MKPMRKDPAGSKATERKFYRHIEALINSYQSQCTLFLGRYEIRLLEVQKLPISHDDLIKSVQQLADITIVQKAELVASLSAELSYLHGMKWAEKVLGLRGMRNTATGITKPFYLPPERRAIDAIASRNFMEIKGMSDELAKRMSRTLVDGFEKGETINKLIKRVQEVTDFGKGRATVIARTETMRALNTAAEDRYRREGVERVEWIAALDDRVCEECSDLHGQIFDMGNIPDLPVHPNCRCTIAAVLPGD